MSMRIMSVSNVAMIVNRVVRHWGFDPQRRSLGLVNSEIVRPFQHHARAELYKMRKPRLAP